MFSKMKRAVLGAIVLFLLISCDDGRLSVNLEGWKVSLGDNAAWAATNFDDSSWEILRDSSLDLGKGHYAWLRKEVSVPDVFSSDSVWLGLKKINAAVDVYANGVLIGTRGSFPPRENVRKEETSDFLIPRSLIRQQTVTLALRIYCPTSMALQLYFSLDNSLEADFQNVFHNIFNQRFFVVLAFLCIFIMIYSFAIFLGNTKDLTYLHFSWCLLFISIYFYDLGSERQIFSYAYQHALAHACLPISMGFITLFINRFFNRKHYKALLVTSVAIDLIAVVAHILVAKNQPAEDLVFNLMLLPVMLAIIYGFVASIKGLKAREPYALNIFFGFSVGTILAIHDVVYSILGLSPFMWTQALAFFAVDLAVFITLSMRSSRSQKQVRTLARETETQHKKLSEIFSSAKEMVEKTAQISDELSESVKTVAIAANNSREKVSDINQAIREQTKISSETSETVNRLSSFLINMNSEFDRTTESIQTTAEGTQEVMAGIENVSEGISIAAGFTKSLSSVTKTGSDDMKKLMAVMTSIQKSSKEILTVASTLDGFAQQTNLLSMNASIEAAHAGEVGKGFGVIAHEIKDLASQSSAWAAKIGEIITEVSEGISESVSLSKKVSQTLMQIQEGSSLSAEKVGSASESVQIQQQAGISIAREAGTMMEMAKKMRKELSEQSSFSTQVADNMGLLMNVSQKVNVASLEISDVSQTLTDEVEALKGLADRTREAAFTLERLMKTDSGDAKK